MLDTLPEDLLQAVASHLSGHELHRFRQTCRACKTACDSTQLPMHVCMVPGEALEPLTAWQREALGRCNKLQLRAALKGTLDSNQTITAWFARILQVLRAQGMCALQLCAEHHVHCVVIIQLLPCPCHQSSLLVIMSGFRGHTPLRVRSVPVPCCSMLHMPHAPHAPQAPVS